MSGIFKLISQTFQPVDFGDGVTSFQDGNVLNRYKQVLTFTWGKSTPKKRLQINVAAKSITNYNPLDYDGFVSDDGIQPGEKFKIQGAVNNVGVFTVATVSDTIITTVEALVAEPGNLIEVAYIYITSLPDAIEYFYNHIGNSEQENYISKTDDGVMQKYTASGLNAAPGTTQYLNIGTASRAWVTDLLNGNQSTSTIEYVSSAGVGQAYANTYIVTHYYSIAPVWTKNQFSNFLNKIAPSWFSGSFVNPLTGVPIANSLQYICRVNLKYNGTDATPIASNGFVFNNGNSSWFNANNQDSQPDFTVASIAYADGGGNPWPAMDFSKNITVTAKLKSTAGQFVNAGMGLGTKFIVQFLYCPQSDVAYKNTPTTLFQNMMFDQAVQTLGAAGVNGLMNGGNYQVIQGVTGTYVDAHNATIIFSINMAAFLKAILTGKQAQDRVYLLDIVCE